MGRNWKRKRYRDSWPQFNKSSTFSPLLTNEQDVQVCENVEKGEKAGKIVFEFEPSLLMKKDELVNIVEKLGMGRKEEMGIYTKKQLLTMINEEVQRREQCQS